jgi:hypothetical protein
MFVSLLQSLRAYILHDTTDQRMYNIHKIALQATRGEIIPRIGYYFFLFKAETYPSSHSDCWPLQQRAR